MCSGRGVDCIVASKRLCSLSANSGVLPMETNATATASAQNWHESHEIIGSWSGRKSTQFGETGPNIVG